MTWLESDQNIRDVAHRPSSRRVLRAAQALSSMITAPGAVPAEHAYSLLQLRALVIALAAAELDPEGVESHTVSRASHRGIGYGCVNESLLLLFPSFSYPLSSI